MNVARRSDGLLPGEQLEALLAMISNQSPSSGESLCQALRALRGASPVRTLNTLNFLREIGVVSDHGGQWSPADSAGHKTQELSSEQVRDAFLTHYAARLESSNVGTAFQTEQDQDLWVDSFQLPCRELGYPFMLIILGIAERETLSSRFWRIAVPFAAPFLNALRRINASRFAVGRFGQEELAKALAARSAAGLQAEEWVVRFERDRIGAHIFVESIRRVSETDVGAGYDILSFDTSKSLVHDRFIEVKSFRDEPQFHWSKGEMDAARELGVRYWLYLIDRARLDEPGYVPDMISDPAAYFLDRKPEGWELAGEGLFFTRSSS
jgi:hypothetical protein